MDERGELHVTIADDYVYQDARLQIYGAGGNHGGDGDDEAVGVVGWD